MQEWQGTPTKLVFENAEVWGVAITQPKGEPAPRKGDLVQVTAKSGTTWTAVLMDKHNEQEAGSVKNTNSQQVQVMITRRFVTAKADEPRNVTSKTVETAKTGNGKTLKYGKNGTRAAAKAAAKTTTKAATKASGAVKTAKAVNTDKMLQGSPKRLEDGSWGVIVFYNEQPQKGQEIRVKPQSATKAPWISTITEVVKKATNTSCAVCRATAPPKN